jgi:xylulokinase
VFRSSDSEVGARGAFLVGLAATGAVPGIEDAAARHVRLRAAVQPDPDAYQGAYRDFLALREGGAGSWPLLAAMREDRT